MSTSGSYPQPPPPAPHWSQPAVPGDGWQAEQHRTPAPTRDGLAITALLLAIFLAPVPFLPAIVALFMASAARRNINASEGTRSGTAMATWAQVISVLTIAIWFAVVGLLANAI